MRFCNIGIGSFLSSQAVHSANSGINPSSLLHCIDDDGKLSVDSYRRLLLEEDDMFAIHQANLAAAIREYILESDSSSSDNEDYAVGKSKNRKKRGSKAVLWYTDEFGVRRVLPPTKSSGYQQYIQHPNLDNNTFHKRFRRRFRMPYASYLELVEIVKESQLFDRWKEGRKDAVGNDAAPINLLVLCALHYLGRGWTFDDLAESTAISEEVIHIFFHKFIEWGSTILFEKHVNAPLDLETARAQEHEFREAGLPGCVGSMDATHVALERCSYRMRQLHLAQKLPYTARTYNIVVNHRRRILSTTQGHPARWNDKSIVKFDPFVMGLRHGELLDDLTFELYDYDNNGNTIVRKYKGGWLLVDNGYHQWSVTVPPIKTTTLRTEIRFSQ